MVIIFVYLTINRYEFANSVRTIVMCSFHTYNNYTIFKTISFFVCVLKSIMKL